MNVKKVPLNCEECGNRNYNVPKKKALLKDWPLRNTVQDAMLIQYIKNQNKQYAECDKDIVKRFGGFISG